MQGMSLRLPVEAVPADGKKTLTQWTLGGLHCCGPKCSHVYDAQSASSACCLLSLLMHAGHVAEAAGRG